jgi:hypothetical protein
LTGYYSLLFYLRKHYSFIKLLFFYYLLVINVSEALLTAFSGEKPEAEKDRDNGHYRINFGLP